MCGVRAAARPLGAAAAAAVARGRARPRAAEGHSVACAAAIILLTTKTLLSRKRPAQLATQLASLESSLLPGLVMHFSKQMSVSLDMAAWITAFWFSVSMKACSSLTCPSDGSCSMVVGDTEDCAGDIDITKNPLVN